MTERPGVERAARIVATYWLEQIMGSRELHSTGMSHPLAMVMAALDGETDPAQLGVASDSPAASELLVLRAAAPAPPEPGSRGEKEIYTRFHLTNGNMDAINAALQRTFAIYSDPEAGTDLDGDAVTMLDALLDYGYIAVARTALIDALTPAPSGPALDVERLARALHRVAPEAHQRHKCRDRHDLRAAAIAAEYTRLLQAPDPLEGRTDG